MQPEIATYYLVKKKKIYLPNESRIKLNQINAKGRLPEEQTLIDA